MAILQMKWPASLAKKQNMDKLVTHFLALLIVIIAIIW